MRLLLFTMTLFLAACPGFEDAFSGTYRQVLTADDISSEPIAIEVFRFGHNVHAMVRFHSGGVEPFASEMRCAWTEPTTLSDDNTFEALLDDPVQRIRLSGRFEGDRTLKARLNAPGGNSPDLSLGLVAEIPDDTCRTIAPRSVTAKFGNLSSQNEFAPGEYEIRNPYFGIQWIAVQPIQTGTIAVWTAFTPELLFSPLESKVTSNRRGLSGQLNLTVEAPGEEYRTVSGDTRYSIAHFIVVDDEVDEDSFVRWDRATEPIIASGVRGGTRLDAPAFADEHNQFGRALLFVEGRLDSLGRMLDIIEIVEEDVDADGELETVDPTAHFFVAEVFAEDERIVGLRLRPSPALTIPVTVTTEFLDQTGLPLPRLFPLD